MSRLEQKVAIVTGAGSGVGKEHALLLASEGAQVVVNDIGEAANETVSNIKSKGGKAVSHIGSVSDWNTGEDLVTTALDNFGDLHILINNAGILRDAMSFSMSEQEFDEVIEEGESVEVSFGDITFDGEVNDHSTHA